MWQTQTHKSSFRESLNALEADIQHANSLAGGLAWDLSGHCVQMKVSYSPLAPFLLILIEWMDYSCLDSLPTSLGLLHILVYKVYVDGMPTIMSPQERKATLRDFYAVIYPSLKQMEGNLMGKTTQCSGGEDECGICMESGANMVLPNCAHSMCINCFHHWYIRSQSCPFCRGSLKRVESGDLWVLTGNSDVVDTITLAHHNLKHFYLYIDKLPRVVSETNASFYDYLM
ncbi:PREDICTED: uncharacterized protein LOC109147100 isoform X2 [Ipomoea nil]|uniref:uncharacterized protein LOC109147100 isoform X2 n=1 Tax=Ipomoea nil TaxID=35883 RepID=UPI00090131A6|nr:PREDICTED: uncharacterized protein LOC109147100 isoform X2 [Ipomoea nil]